MRFYTQQHRFYCGVDLHARTMYVHILDHTGKTVFEQDLPADPGEFLESLRYELATREIFVFTPKGDVITLPAGSTPVMIELRLAGFELKIIRPTC